MTFTSRGLLRDCENDGALHSKLLCNLEHGARHKYALIALRAKVTNSDVSLVTVIAAPTRE